MISLMKGLENTSLIKFLFMKLFFNYQRKNGKNHIENLTEIKQTKVFSFKKTIFAL